jgi:hypothetical protein
MNDFDKIYLGWSRGVSNPFYTIGILEKEDTGKFVFKYDGNEVKEAQQEGFKPYLQFQDTNKTYNGNVLDIFAQRLINPERTDVQKFYDFWEIEPEHFNDKFYLLGHTQGLVPTDNFEFLADYNPVRGLHFITDIAGLSAFQHSADKLALNDELQIKLEGEIDDDNEAVAVYKNELKIGYIKKIHCRVFRKAGGDKLKVKIKAVYKNGVIKKAFVKVYSDNI